MLGFVNTTVTMDKAGRVVLPKELRDELRLEPDDRLELESDGKRVTLRPIHSSTPLMKEHGIWVLRTGRKLSASVTRQAIRNLRETRCSKSG
jgi:AbrB family looped-hinge helix DNA binding protein